MTGRWVDDPNGVNPPQWVAGYDPAMGQQSEGPGQHGNILATYLKTQGQVVDPRKSALPYVLPYAMWAGGLGAGASAANAILNNPGSTLLPGSLAASTAVPVSSLVAPGLTAAVTGAGATAAAGATPSAVAGGASAGGVGAGTAATTGVGAGGAAGGTAAATGGGLASLPKILDYAGKGLGAIAGSQTYNRSVDNFNTQNQDQDALARALLGSNNIERDLAQRMYLNQDYQRNAHNAVYGGLLQGAQDVNITGLPEGVTMGNITGGARPSAFTGRQEIGANLQKNALPNLQNPPGLDSLPKIPDVPPVTPLQGASGTEKGLGYLSAGLPILEQLFGSKGTSAAPQNLALNVGSQLLPNLLNVQTQQPLPTAPPKYNGYGMGGASFLR